MSDYDESPAFIGGAHDTLDPDEPSYQSRAFLAKAESYIDLPHPNRKPGSLFPRKPLIPGNISKDYGVCKDCRAGLLWVTTDNGKRMPLNSEPIKTNEHGAWSKREDGRWTAWGNQGPFYRRHSCQGNVA